MNNSITIPNAFIIGYTDDEMFQSYLVTFDLVDNTRDNVKLWEQFFSAHGHGEPLILKLEVQNVS